MSDHGQVPALPEPWWSISHRVLDQLNDQLSAVLRPPGPVPGAPTMTMQDLLDLVRPRPDRPRPREMRVSRSFYDAMHDTASAEVGHRVPPAESLYGVPLVVDEDLEPGAWQMVGGAGETLTEYRPKQGGKLTAALEQLAERAAAADTRRRYITSDPVLAAQARERLGDVADVQVVRHAPAGAVLEMPADTSLPFDAKPVSWA